MQRDIVDPAALGVGREQRDLTLGIQCDELAVIATHDDALAIRRGAEDAAAVDVNFRNFALPVHEADAFLGPDERGAVADKVHGGDGSTDRNRAHLVGDGRNGGLMARLEGAHHETMQRSKPSRIICSGNSRPMKTRRLSRGSPSFHFR